MAKKKVSKAEPVGVLVPEELIADAKPTGFDIIEPTVEEFVKTVRTYLATGRFECRCEKEGCYLVNVDGRVLTGAPENEEKVKEMVRRIQK